MCREGDKLAPQVQKKMNELEVGLLHLQQNIDIPEITLPIHPAIQVLDVHRTRSITDYLWVMNIKLATIYSYTRVASLQNILNITSVCGLHSYPLPYLVCDHNNLIVSSRWLVVTGVSHHLGTWSGLSRVPLNCTIMNMYPQRMWECGNHSYNIICYLIDVQFCVPMFYDGCTAYRCTATFWPVTFFGQCN